MFRPLTWRMMTISLPSVLNKCADINDSDVRGKNAGFLCDFVVLAKNSKHCHHMDLGLKYVTRSTL